MRISWSTLPADPRRGDSLLVLTGPYRGWWGVRINVYPSQWTGSYEGSPQWVSLYPLAIRARIRFARIARAVFFWALCRFGLRRNLRMLAIEHAEMSSRVFYMRAVFGRRAWDEAVAWHEADITAYRARRDRT